MTDPTSATSTTGVATPYSSRQMGTGTAVDRTSLGKDQFLNLLVTQMRYQDPSKPMDSDQIMAQTAQLTTVEQLTELTTTQREAFGLQMRLSAAGFVGQQVTWTDAKGTKRTGVVDSADFADATPALKVGDQRVALDKVGLVSRAGTTPQTTPQTTPTSTTPTSTSGSGSTTGTTRTDGTTPATDGTGTTPATSAS